MTKRKSRYFTIVAAAQSAGPKDDAARRPSPALLDLKAQWAKMSARQKLRARQLAVGVAVGALGIGLYAASGSKEDVKQLFIEYGKAARIYH